MIFEFIDSEKCKFEIELFTGNRYNSKYIDSFGLHLIIHKYVDFNIYFNRKGQCNCNFLRIFGFHNKGHFFKPDFGWIYTIFSVKNKKIDWDKNDTFTTHDVRIFCDKIVNNIAFI